MSMSGFICHDDYYDRLKRLSNEEVGNLFRQLMLYHAGRYDEMSDFIDNEGIAFDFIANDIDRMEEKHNAISETNRINGSKGGRPKKQKEPEETEENRNKPNETERNRQKAYKDKDKDKDIDKDKKNTVRRFTPPTLEEVSAYCKERKNNVDPERFVDYYTSKGWLVGKTQMKDWKAAVRTWEKTGTTVTKKQLPAQDFEQRSYTDVSDQIMDELAKEMATFKGA